MSQRDTLPTPPIAADDGVRRRPGAMRARLRTFVTRISRSFRTGGPPAVACDIHSMVLYRVHGLVLDRLGAGAEPAQVSKTRPLDGLTIASKHRDEGVEYTPTPRLVIAWLQALLPRDVSAWTFVDIGAGRGRVVALAARYPYRRVLGVEFAAELQRDARRYIEALPPESRKARHIGIVTADATAFDIPDGPCVFYLYNPFAAPVLRTFLARVTAAQQSQPRQMRIAYFNPKHGTVMDEFPAIRKCPLPLKARLKFALLSPCRLHLYEVGGD